jgi:hypothetical protein
LQELGPDEHPIVASIAPTPDEIAANILRQVRS